MGKKQKDRAFRQRTLDAAMSAVGLINSEGAASAVYVNDDGLGQALVYPYYTMRAGQEVLISTPRATPNTDEVLGFSLFLSPRNVWTGAVESAQGLDGVMYHVPGPVLARAALDSLAALADPPQAVVAGVGTDWVIHMMHPGLLVGEARIREGYVEVIDMGSSRHLGQYPQDLRQVALFGLQTLPYDDREEFLRNISHSAVIADPSEGPQDGYFHPESILGRPRGPRAVNQHLVRGSKGRNRGAKR